MSYNEWLEYNANAKLREPREQIYVYHVTVPVKVRLAEDSTALLSAADLFDTIRQDLEDGWLDETEAISITLAEVYDAER